MQRGRNGACGCARGLWLSHVGLVPDRIEETAKAIAAALRRRRDPVRARTARSFFKHEIVALGIPAAVMRAFARERAELLAEWSIDALVRLCDRLLEEPEIEIRMVGPLILARRRKHLTAALLPHASRWLKRRLDNWALVDGFCGEVLAPMLTSVPEVETALRRWSKSPVLWQRRAALVTLVPHARHGERLDLAYELAAAHLHDPEDLMHKATGWLLREAGRKDRPRLKRFLLKNGSAVPRTALRYALEHFPTEERRVVMTATRGE